MISAWGCHSVRYSSCPAAVAAYRRIWSPVCFWCDHGVGFDVAVDQDPYITFHSTKIQQTGTDTFSIEGTFTIRGVSKPETLNLTLSGKGTGHGHIAGTMAFDRKEFGMNSGIPFIKIADRVEVTVDLTADRISGPPVVLKE